MENDDPGPGRFLIFTLAVLVLLVQLDVLGATIHSGGNMPLETNYCVAEEEEQSIEIPEEFYAGFRFAVPVLPRLVLNYSESASPEIVSAFIPHLLKRVPQTNRQAHSLYCVYLL